MLNYAYYPFNNSLEELDAGELATLKTVAEGWYIEYKSQPLKKVDDLARHLTAFANQYGGFLFVGIKEADGGSKCAGSFSGIDDSELDNLSIQIREASSAHANPPILYEEKIIKGPCEEIGLPEHRSIVIIGIPKSVNTPHIHSSGRIYRRLADHSDPKPETDRHILDDLWKRGESHRQQVSKFLSNTPPLPDSMSKSAWAYVYFRPDENQPRPSKILTFEEFAATATNSDNCISGPYAQMDAVYNAPSGFIARQTKGNSDPSLPSFTFRWWHDGTARFEIPLNKYDLKSFLNSGQYKHAIEFSALLHHLNFKGTTLVDYSRLLMSISAFTNMYLVFLGKVEDTRDVYSNFILKNISYTSPYFDTAHYLSKVKQYSLPLTIENEIRVPQEPSQSAMFLHPYKRLQELKNEPNSEIITPIVFAVPLTLNILQCVGVIHNAMDMTDSEIYELGITQTQ